jgi:hypothetical protein
MKQTAEEFYKDYCNKRITIGSLNGHERLEVMIEFAKFHVEAALKAAAETNYPSTKANFELVNSRILNAYSLDNIK